MIGHTHLTRVDLNARDFRLNKCIHHQTQQVYTPSGDTKQEEINSDTKEDIEILLDIEAAADKKESTRSASSGSRPGGPLDTSPLRISNLDSLSTEASSVPEQFIQPEPVDEPVDTFNRP